MEKLSVEQLTEEIKKVIENELAEIFAGTDQLSSVQEARVSSILKDYEKDKDKKDSPYRVYWMKKRESNYAVPLYLYYNESEDITFYLNQEDRVKDSGDSWMKDGEFITLIQVTYHKDGTQYRERSLDKQDLQKLIKSLKDNVYEIRWAVRRLRDFESSILNAFGTR